MYWTPELVKYFEDAPLPSTKVELLDFAFRSALPAQIIDNLIELEDSDELIESVEDIWPEYENLDDVECFYHEDDDVLHKLRKQHKKIYSQIME